MRKSIIIIQAQVRHRNARRSYHQFMTKRNRATKLAKMQGFDEDL